MGIMGLLYLVGHFFQKVDEGGHREGYGFAVGALLIILAIFVVEKQQMLLALVPFLFGIMVLIRGLIIIQNLFFFRRMGLGLVIPLISGVLTTGLGLAAMLYLFEKMSVLFTFIGIGLVVGGVAGIIEEILVFIAARKQAEVLRQVNDVHLWSASGTGFIKYEILFIPPRRNKLECERHHKKSHG